MMLVLVAVCVSVVMVKVAGANLMSLQTVNLDSNNYSQNDDGQYERPVHHQKSDKDVQIYGDR